jgi:SAM-dependent methyltransferase
MPALRKPPLPYRFLAEHYDALFTPFRAPLLKARKRVLGSILPGVETACDLACGTGTTALELAALGIRVYAVDGSPQMCRIAREKGRKEGAPVRVLRGDLRSFRLPEPVDLITCEGDAINHVSRPADLRRVLAAVSRALHPGGYFYFDVNLAKGFECYWTGVTWLESKDVAMIMRNGHNKKLDKAWSDIEIFAREGPSCWRRYHDHVDEVSWKESVIERVLQEAGFEEVRSWDAELFFGSKSPVGPGCRSVYRARRGARS